MVEVVVLVVMDLEETQVAVVLVVLEDLVLRTMETMGCREGKTSTYPFGRVTKR